MPAVRHRLVGTTVRDRVLAARLRGEEGFGLIELLIAMPCWRSASWRSSPAFSSGIVALNSASRTGTAGTLADRQMEAYRALRTANISAQQRSTPRPATDYATRRAIRRPRR